MSSNAEELTSNLQALLSIHKKAIDVLNSAKSKNHHEISSAVGIASTTVSTILNRAKGYGYIIKADGKWKKTNEIKGQNLYRMAKVKFTDSLSPRKGFSNEGTRSINPLKPLSHYKEAGEMMEAYRVIFCLENTLRNLLRSTFGNEKGWMDNRLDDNIKKDIKRAKNEPYYTHNKRKDDLDCVTLGHLFQIITSNKNWKDVLPTLKEQDKSSFINTFKKILPSRNYVAHCIYLDKTNRGLVESRAREIAMMFKL
ncbi:MAG: hypothetical protein ABSF79_03655 [Smithellaceae bacterium]|jgi:hypothetical protein